MGYFCTQCKRKHFSGKIYKEHQHFEKVKKEEIPFREVLSFSFNLLPPIAQRQIMIYAEKMKWDSKNNGSDHRYMYIQEINKIILHYDNNTPIIL